MNSKLRNDLWVFKQAKKVNSFDKAIFLGLIFAGLLSMFNLTEWWFKGDHISNLFLFIILSLLFGYGIIRVALIWINYLRLSKPEEVHLRQ